MSSNWLNELIIDITKETLKDSIIEKYAIKIAKSAIYVLDKISFMNEQTCLENEDYISVIWETLVNIKENIIKKPQILRGIQSYVQISFKNRFVDYAKKFNTKKYKVLNSSDPMLEENMIERYVEEDPLSKMVSQMQRKNAKLSTIFEHFFELENLKKSYKNIGELLLMGYSVKEIADKTNYSIRQVYRIKNELISIVKSKNLD